MKTHLAIATAVSLLSFSAHSETQIPNRLIDYSAFLNNAEKVKAVRESRRLTEDQFLQAMSEPGVVVLDARSAAKFELRHLRRAVNLSLPDFTAAELAKLIPSTDTKILIYCNNNFWVVTAPSHRKPLPRRLTSRHTSILRPTATPTIMSWDRSSM